jgi:FAD/FMN-containing dehydrogenase
MARELATALDRARLASFRDVFDGEIVLRDDAEYDSARRVWNGMGDAGEDVARVIYGDAQYELLRALKRTWDPENVFRLNQSIRP